MDRRKPSNEERKILYEVMKDLMDDLNWTLDKLLEAALGKKVHYGKGYDKNCADGKMSIKNARAVYDWMLQKHPKYAKEVEKSCLKLKSKPRIKSSEGKLVQIGDRYYRENDVKSNAKAKNEMTGVKLNLREPTGKLPKYITEKDNPKYNKFIEKLGLKKK